MTDPTITPDVAALLAQLGRLDIRPETIAAMQRGLDRAWASLEDWPPEVTVQR